MRFQRPAFPFTLVLVAWLSLLAVIGRAAPAAPENYGVDFWREADGLPQSRIRQIIQARDGYLWLGTVGGLVRFDGARFTSFGVHTGSLRDNEVWAIREDRDGALWLGTVSGGLTRYHAGKFTTYTEQDGLPDDVIRHIDFDPMGNLWVATLRGLSRRENGRFRTFGEKDGLLHPTVTRLSASSAEGVFAVSGDRLHRFVGERFQLDETVLDRADGRPLALATGRDGALWIYCEAGVAKRLSQGTVTSYAIEQRLAARNAFIYQDVDGTVWMGARDGLRRLEGGIFRRFHPRGTPTQLGLVLGLANDREGSLWIGLETSGIARLRRAHFFTLGEEDGLTELGIRSVYQDRHGSIWIGTASGFARWRDGQVTNYTSLDGVPIPWVNSFAEHPDGTLWIAAGGDILWMKDETLRPMPGWKRTTDIKAVFRDPQSRMWITTDGDGVFRFDRDGVTRLRRQDGLASDHVRGILSDRTGAMWLTTFGGGVSRYADGEFVNYTVADGLGSNRVVSVFEHSDGSLWFGTRAGVSRIREGTMRNFTVAHGLPVNFVSSISEDSLGNLWFSCDQGLFQASPDGFEAVVHGRASHVKLIRYGVKDGMRSAGFMAGQQPSAWTTTDGRLLFASLRGLVVVDPMRPRSNSLAPPVHIERVVINGEPQPLGGFAELGPGDGNVQIDYTALSFLAPEKVRFRYRLDGFDKDWVDAETRRFAHYGNLPPGDYTFRVTACNNDGVWNEAGGTFAFRLRPFFYHTRWFYGLCGLAVVVAPALAYRLRLRQLKARERELRAKIAEEVGKVRVLRGMLPICASCKQIRDDRGYWNQIEVYIREHSDTQFSHGICPDCIRQLYPEVADQVLAAAKPQVPPPPRNHR